MNDPTRGGKTIKGIERQSSSDKPLVSIITVVKNGERYIEQTIQSVLQQTYNNIEYIVIDGVSSDGTLDIIRKYENNIDLWISENDNGIYYAINKGISRANGEFIGIINSDDWYEADTVEIAIDKFLGESQAEVIHGLHRIWNESELLGIVGHTDIFLKYGMISHPSCFVRRETYLKNGLYNTIYRIAADYELMLRFSSKKVRFEFIERILSNFRNTGVSNTAKGRILFETNEIRRLYGLISKSDAFISNVGFKVKSIFH